MPRRRICLYVAGWPAESVRQRFGTYVDWFARLIAEHDLEVDVFDGTRGTGELPARHAELGGIVITGSPASLTAPEPWMEAAIELIRSAYRRRTPLLGVCFGHQLIGAAFGGSVVRNPAGWQLASRAIDLNERGQSDPLFAGLPALLDVNLSHEDIVVGETLAPANGIEILASNAKATVAAVAAGPTIRGIQFHPEFSGEITRTYIQERRHTLARESEQHGAPHDHPDTLLEQVGDSPHGERVFHNFIDHFVL